MSQSVALADNEAALVSIASWVYSKREQRLLLRWGWWCCRHRKGQGCLPCPAPACSHRVPSWLSPKGAVSIAPHLHGAFAFNTTCDFSCPEGLEATGAWRLRCTAGGLWMAPRGAV